MTTSAQDQGFNKFMRDKIDGAIDEALDSVVDSALLEDEVIPWMKANMEPGDVFGDDALEKWARDNGYVTKGELDEAVGEALKNADKGGPVSDAD